MCQEGELQLQLRRCMLSCVQVFQTAGGGRAEGTLAVHHWVGAVVGGDATGGKEASDEHHQGERCLNFPGAYHGDEGQTNTIEVNRLPRFFTASSYALMNQTALDGRPCW